MLRIALPLLAYRALMFGFTFWLTRRRRGGNAMD
jgi:hypothetical protein